MDEAAGGVRTIALFWYLVPVMRRRTSEPFSMRIWRGGKMTKVVRFSCRNR